MPNIQLLNLTNDGEVIFMIRDEIYHYIISPNKVEVVWSINIRSSKKALNYIKNICKYWWKEEV